MPREQNPLSVSAFKTAGFAQREQCAMGLVALYDGSTVVKLHRLPGEISFCPDCQLSCWNFNAMGGVNLLSLFSFEVEPSHLCSPPDRITGNVCIMSHESRECINVLFRICLNQCTNCRFRIVIIGQAHAMG